MHVLIVDDEPLARDVIKHWLANKPEIENLAECGAAREALEYLRRKPVDLVFLDVQMAEMNGFELLRDAQLERMPLVIFVTAHHRYAVEAFEAHAVDYLLKPFDQERFDRAFARARATLDNAKAKAINRQLCSLLESVRSDRVLPFEDSVTRPARYPSRLTVRNGGKITFVHTSDLLWLEADGDYVNLKTGSGRHLIHDTLGRLEAQLDPQQFVRVHRSVVVNLEHIREMETYFNGEYHIVMHDGTRLKSSRTYRERLLAALHKSTV